MSAHTSRFLAALLTVAIALQGFPAAALAEAAVPAPEKPVVAEADEDGEVAEEDAPDDDAEQERDPEEPEEPEDPEAGDDTEDADADDAEQGPEAEAVDDAEDADADWEPEAEKPEADDDACDVADDDVADDSEQEDPASDTDAAPDADEPEDTLTPQGETPEISGTCGTCAWEFANGVLTIHEGTLPSIAGSYAEDNAESWPWHALRERVTSVVLDGDVAGSGGMACAFYQMGNLESASLSALDTSEVTDLDRMFWGCSSLASLDLSGWNTSAVTNMEGMFHGCSSLTSLELSGWGTSKVIYMAAMFKGCSVLSSLDLSGWDTSSVMQMHQMFHGCSTLSSLDLSGWDTSDVRNMTEMFSGCSSLEKLYVGPGWSTEKVSSFSFEMFNGCTSIEGGNGTAYSPDYTDKTYARIDGPGAPGYLTFVGDTIASGRWGTCPWEIGADFTLTVHPGEGADQSSEVQSPWAGYAGYIASVVFLEEGGSKAIAPTNSQFLLGGLTNVVSVDASGLDTSNVTSMSSMFGSCSSLESLDLSGWDTSKVGTMYRMFNGCGSLASVDLSSWDTSNVGGMGSMFSGCSSLAALDPSGWDTSKVGDMESMFDGCGSLASLDLSGWDTSNVGYMGYMFYGCSSLEKLYVGSGWSTAKGTSSYEMFNGCTSIEGGNGTAYSPDYTDKTYARIDGPGAPGYLTFVGDTIASGTWGTCPWEIGADFTLTVHPGEGADQSGEVQSPWAGYAGYIASVVFLEEGGAKVVAPEDSRRLLLDLSGVTSVHASGLDTSSVRNMDCMFYGCSSLEYLDLFSWDTSSVTYMTRMFYGCSSLESLDLSGWDTSSVTDMGYVFYGCTSLEKVYAGPGWSTNSVTYSAEMFVDCTSIVGGNGTTYDSSYTDKTYARVDAPGTPGYFVMKAVDVSILSVGSIADWTYTGSEINPGVMVRHGSRTLVAGTDYELSYANNTNAGTATITVKGKGDYTGERDVEFEIVPCPISSATVALSETSFTYDGTAKEPAVSSVVVNEQQLDAGTDYTVSYEGNVNAGTARAVITGAGNYAGTAIADFSIAPAETAAPSAKTGLVCPRRAKMSLGSSRENVTPAH